MPELVSDKRGSPDKGIVDALVGDWAVNSVEAQPNIYRFNTLKDRVKKLYNFKINAILAKNLQNAAWTSKEGVPTVIKHHKFYGVNPAKAKELATPAGLVMIGPQYKKLGVLAHELGHAVANKSGNKLEQLAHKPFFDRYSGLYHTIPALAAAFIGSRGGRPLRGALAGGLTGLLTYAPITYGEIAANKYARKLMTPEENEQVSYTPTLGTYVAGSTWPYALIGALASLRR